MSIFFAVLVLLAGLNLGIFALLKLFGLVEPYVLKLFFRKHDFSALFTDPELLEKGKIRAKYTHWFWSAYLVLFYAVTPLTGINYFLAFTGGLVLYMIGTNEARALADVSTKYREKEYVETQELTEKFFEEVAKRMESLQVEPSKKDDERN